MDQYKAIPQGYIEQTLGVYFSHLGMNPLQENVCYFAIVILPMIYNYLSDSALKSPLSLVLSGGL